VVSPPRHPLVRFCGVWARRIASGAVESIITLGAPAPTGERADS
jgi:hypothetical protein